MSLLLISNGATQIRFVNCYRFVNYQFSSTEQGTALYYGSTLSGAQLDCKHCLPGRPYHMLAATLAASIC
jgi:hypothetical protein